MLAKIKNNNLLLTRYFEEAQEVHLSTSCAFQIGWRNKITTPMTASAFCTISLILILDLNWGGGGGDPM